MQREGEGSVLFWGKPEKAMSTQQWQAISADGAPPGVYVPNMSDEDRRRWKAKLLGQRSGELRAEVRKSLSSKGSDTRAGTYAQALIIVYADGEVRVSANGAMAFSEAEWRELHTAVAEARAALVRYQSEQSCKALPERTRKATETS